MAALLEDIYFLLDLTESEHGIVEAMLQELCAEEGMQLVYYRKNKTGHIPCIREVKVRFLGKKGKFYKFMDDNALWENAKRWESGKLVDWNS